MKMEIHLHTGATKIVKFQFPESIRVSGSEFSARGRTESDYDNIVTAWTVWSSLLIDATAMLVGDEVVRGTMIGRIINGVSLCPADLTVCFEQLDVLGDILLQYMCTHRHFKGDDFRDALSTWQPGCPTLSLVKGVIRKWADYPQSDNGATLLRLARSVSCFFKKLDVDRPDLDQKAAEDFVSFEMELATAIPARAQDPVYCELTQRMHQLLIDTYDCVLHTDPVPRHGPGVVADKSCHCQMDKYLSMTIDSRIDYLLGKRGLRMADYNPYLKEGCDRINRFISVPKNWKKKRTISAEPAGLQYFQQAIRRDLYTHLERDKWWGRRVRFSDQQRSRELALLGSLSGSYATIDLSSASDSVTLDLVQRVFGNTELARWLIATRSIGTQVNELLLPRVKKFAPMGSATCFPVETMVFTLAAELATRDSWTGLEMRSCPVVYGDDIIVPWYASEKLIEYLSILGFTVNTEKSYTDGWFREACGIEAWAGSVVTPFRFKRLYAKSRITGSNPIGFEDVSRVVNMTNALEFLGAHSSSRLVLHDFLHRQVKIGRQRVRAAAAVLFSPDPSDAELGYIWSSHATNFQVKERWVESADKGNAYQTTEHFLLTWNKRVDSRTKVRHADPRHEELEYLEWLIRRTIDPRPDNILMDLLSDPAEEDEYRLITLGYTMVPSFKWTVR